MKTNEKLKYKYLKICTFRSDQALIWKTFLKLVPSKIILYGQLVKGLKSIWLLDSGIFTKLMIPNRNY